MPRPEASGPGGPWTLLRALHLLRPLFLLGSSPALLYGQAPAGPSNPDFDVEWRWADFDQESGYSGGRVLEMVEVGDTLWVRAEGGMFWFDGFGWHRVGPGEGLPDGQPTSVDVGSRGDLTVSVGWKLHRGTVRGFKPLTHTGWEEDRYHVWRAFDSPWGLVVSAGDRVENRNRVYLWEEGGVREITPESGVLFPANLWRSAGGSVWLNANSGLFRLMESGWEPVLGPGPEVHEIPYLWDTPDGRGFAFQRVPLEDRGILAWEDGGAPRRIPGEGENDIVSGTVTHAGLVFVVYETGDVRILGEEGWFSPRLPTDRGLGINFVYEDRRGDLWFASNRGIHLFRRSLRRWISIRYPFPDSRNRVNDILAPPGSELWLATHGGLVRHRPGGGVELITEIDGEELGPVTGLARDSAGGVWIVSGASFTGAYRWFSGRWERYGPDLGLDLGRVHKVRVGSDGSIWFLSLGSDTREGSGGVFRLRDGAWERVEDPGGWLNARVYAVAEGPDGALWFGSRRGLIRFSDGEWNRWGPEDGVGGVGGAKVFTLLPDTDGGVWFGFGPGSTMGLGRMDRGGSPSYLTRASGLPGNAVNEIARDSLGVLWISTDEGVARFDGEEWASFGGGAGLNPASAWPLAFRGRSVLIGTTGGGLQVLDRGEEDHPPPQVSLEGPILVERGTVRLRWRALGYRGESAPGRILVRDRFDGQEWSDWGTHRQLWTSERDTLAWGRHTIEIQAKGLHGQLSEPLAGEFTIPYPVHLRPIFYIPLGFLLLALATILLSSSLRRRRTAQALREREARLRTLVETAPDGIAIYDAEADRFRDVNENIMNLTGLSREEFLETHLGGTSPEALSGGGSSRDFLLDRVREALKGEDVVFEWTSRRKNGEEVPVEIRLVPFPSANGNLVRFSVLDIRDRKDAEARRAELEAQLRQSQKLEAVGQLTGGVAHDFNNLLTVILGNMDLLRETRKDDPEIRDLVEGAIGAAKRSALLTQRLLAFSRRQALDNKAIDIPSLVEGLLILLKRSLGETIRVRAEFPGDVWPVTADAGQLEHALINLAVNARDAMPRGGDLYLEGKNVDLEPEVAEKWGGRPGEYVCLSVTDTGLGMDPDVRSRAIDPFFTTKEVGAGSGLGLSMVYGFVTQSGGFIKLFSEVGTGTAVQLFLPRAPTGETFHELEPEEALPQGNGEVILVVEDEPHLQALTKRLAEGMGYRVVTASSGPAALAVLRTGARVDLLFTDVVLPEGMDGVELAQAARKTRPTLPVLFTSGYATQSVLGMARELTNFDLVSKPFDSKTLARNLAEALRT